MVSWYISLVFSMFASVTVWNGNLWPFLEKALMKVGLYKFDWLWISLPFLVLLSSDRGVGVGHAVAVGRTRDPALCTRVGQHLLRGRKFDTYGFCL